MFCHLVQSGELQKYQPVAVKPSRHATLHRYGNELNEVLQHGCFGMLQLKRPCLFIGHLGNFLVGWVEISLHLSDFTAKEFKPVNSDKLL